MKTIKIPELNIEVTYPEVWPKPYNEIVIPEGWELIDLGRLWWIIDSSPYSDEFLGKFKGKYNSFWCKQTKWAKTHSYASGLYLNRDLYLYSYNDDLAGSYEDGRVVFCRPIKGADK